MSVSDGSPHSRSGRDGECDFATLELSPRG